MTGTRAVIKTLLDGDEWSERMPVPDARGCLQRSISNAEPAEQAGEMAHFK